MRNFTTSISSQNSIASFRARPKSLTVALLLGLGGCVLALGGCGDTESFPDEDQLESEQALAGPANRTFYVAPNGSDSRSATQAQSVTTPWKTIGKAALEMAAGDTVKVRAGTYAERVVPARSGSATGGYITFMAYPGETPTIVGTNLTRPAPAVWDAPFNLSNKKYIKVIGFNISKSNGSGVFFRDSQFIEVKKNKISNTQVSGVFGMTSSDVNIVENDIGFANISMKEEAISLSSVVRFSVAKNDIHDGYKEGIDAKLASSHGEIVGNRVSRMAWAGIYLDGFGADQSDIDVHGNIVLDSQTKSTGGSGDGIRLGNEGGGRANRVRIFNNVVYNARNHGVHVSGWTHNGQTPVYSDISIYNNTLHGNGFGGSNNGYGSGIRIDPDPTLYSLRVRNNILTGNKSTALFGTKAADIVSHNLMTGDPQFVSVSNRNFSLKAGSPAIDKGVSISGLTSDFDGSPRAQGSGYDIGAFEYGTQ